MQLVDVNYFGEHDSEVSRKLLTPPMFNLIAYSSKRQRHVADSSTYSEYIACYECCKRILHKLQVCKELGFEQSDGIGSLLFNDNSAVEVIAGTWDVGPRTLHMNNRYHLFRQNIIQKIICLIHAKSETNSSDMYTKILPTKSFNYHRNNVLTDVSLGSCKSMNIENSNISNKTIGIKRSIANNTKLFN
mmetsp:Transcript_14819/g.13403  ORF Transcript_14819/g.13403 Transcript_14819/m.13403 type:complete len:189 (+) Transcript_14819:1970-2536(+)